jgi:hypothetical protein
MPDQCTRSGIPVVPFPGAERSPGTARSGFCLRHFHDVAGWVAKTIGESRIESRMGLVRVLLHESEVSMTRDSNPLDPTANSVGFGMDKGLGAAQVTQRRTADLMSPVLYDLVMWGFAETNDAGQRVLRSDIQARLDGHGLTEQELEGFEGPPLYVGFRCQPCWEAAVTLLTYGQHLCAWRARPVDPPPY